MVIGHQAFPLWQTYILDDSFRTIWHWDFYLITVVNMFAPMLGCGGLVRTAPRKLVRLMMLSAIPYLSLMVISSVAVLNYLVTKKAAFLVTADQTDLSSIYISLKGHVNWIEALDQAHPLVHFFEFATGIVLSIVCLRTLNIALFSFCLCLIMGPLLVRYGWECSFVRLCRYVPFALILFSMGLLGTNLLGAQGVFWPFLSFHF
jgi:hypothetical protein